MRRERTALNRMGVSNELIRLDENGTVEDNAAIVADMIRNAPKERRLILASASKSSAEVALALGDLLMPSETAQVVAWLSVGGVLRGSPMADRAFCWDLYLFTWLKFLFDGYGLEGLKSMQVECLDARFEQLRLPEHILYLSYIGVPLSGDVGPRAQFIYRCLRSKGPNDGLTLLLDQLLPGKFALLEPGVDHFFNVPDRNRRTEAMLRTVLRMVEE